MKRESRNAVALVALVAVLLSALAALQYHWIGELSRAEQRQRRELLDQAARRFAEELDHELGELLFALFAIPGRGADVGGDDRLPLQLELWRARAHYPGLLRDVWLIPAGPDGGPVRRLDQEAGVWREVAELPAELAGLHPGAPAFRPPALLTESLTLLAPRMAGGPGPGRRGGRLEGVIAARLDAEVIADDLLPDLAERHFGPLGSGEYDLAVLGADGKPLYRSDPERPVEALLPGDVRQPLLRPRLPERRGGDGPRRAFEGWSGRAPAGPRPPSPGGPGPEPPDGRWLLVARHSSGSLALAVRQARRRNLAVSGGVLVLLGAAAALLSLATRRAERLGRQQMEFVAGITHELHTPLAAIRSAGHNLADGVVAEPERVRRYGQMIQSEGRRLTETVDQVLEFAGIQSGGRAYRREPVDVAELVDRAVADNALVLEQSGLEVERRVEPDLPPLPGDAAALRRALDNLVANAARYAAAGGWLGLSAERSPDRRELRLRVADRGPGVEPGERQRLFEPFFRGRAAVAGSARGSGLGLSIVRHVVEAHGGRVEVESPAEGGAAFVLHLPLGGEAEAG